MSMGSELSAADVAAVTNHGYSGMGGFGDGNGWWVIVLLLALGGRGFGGFGGGISENYALATDFATIERKLDSVNNGICDSTFALNNTITQGFFNLSSQNAQCCCETQRMIERGFCDLKENANNNTRAILDFMTQQKIDCLRDENQTLKLAASQAKQNNYLIEQLRPTPVPAYASCNPWAAAFGWNNGCGCGNNF